MEAAYIIITNDLICDLNSGLRAWAVDRSEEIQDGLIWALTNSEFDLTLLDVDDRVAE
jgi:hypothetical protein